MQMWGYALLPFHFAGCWDLLYFIVFEGWIQNSCSILLMALNPCYSNRLLMCGLAIWVWPGLGQSKFPKLVFQPLVEVGIVRCKIKATPLIYGIKNLGFFWITQTNLVFMWNNDTFPWRIYVCHLALGTGLGPCGVTGRPTWPLWLQPSSFPRACLTGNSCTYWELINVKPGVGVFLQLFFFLFRIYF